MNSRIPVWGYVFERIVWGPKSWLFSTVVAGTLATAWAAQAGSSYLAVWSSDNETDDKPGVLNTDFLAIIDADPKSRTYGKVVNTASMESVPGANLLNDLGFTDALGLNTKYGLTADGIPSDALNEAHHMTHDPIVVRQRSYLFMGGLISANVFRCDVTDPLHIPTCPLVTTAKDVTNFSGIDDFLQAPNGDVLVTYMGAKDLTTPGGVVEIGVDGTVAAEYAAAKPGGPTRYLPSVRKDHETDTGLLAHPHGIDARADLDLLVTSDYADPLTLATSEDLQGKDEDCGTTVRFLEAIGSEGRAHGNRATSRRQGQGGLFSIQCARRRHDGRAHPPARAQGGVRLDNGRRINLVCAGRHRGGDRISHDIPDRSGCQRPGSLRHAG